MSQQQNESIRERVATALLDSPSENARDTGKLMLGEDGSRDEIVASHGAFEFQPHLMGELVELRPLRPEDFDALYTVASDPLIWEQHPQQDRYEENVFKIFFHDALKSGGALVAIDRKNGKVIGSSRFHGYDREKNEIEIGWTFLARSYWGGAYNRGMKKLMLGHAFQFVNNVVFLIGENNRRSQKAVEKIGASRVKSRLDGNGVERVVYQITSSQWGR